MKKNQETIEIKRATAIEALKTIKPHCCTDDCNICNFSIESETNGYVCPFDVIVNELNWMIK